MFSDTIVSSKTILRLFEIDGRLFMIIKAMLQIHFKLSRSNFIETKWIYIFHLDAVT